MRPPKADRNPRTVRRASSLQRATLALIANVDHCHLREVVFSETSPRSQGGEVGVFNQRK